MSSTGLIRDRGLPEAEARAGHAVTRLAVHLTPEDRAIFHRRVLRLLRDCALTRRTQSEMVTVVRGAIIDMLGRGA